MYDLYQPCPDDPTTSDCAKRIEGQSTVLGQIAAVLFAKLTEAIAINSIAVASIVKLLQQKAQRRLNGNGKSLAIVETALTSNVQNVLTEQQVSINNVINQIENNITNIAAADKDAKPVAIVDKDGKPAYVPFDPNLPKPLPPESKPGGLATSPVQDNSEVIALQKQLADLLKIMQAKLGEGDTQKLVGQLCSLAPPPPVIPVKQEAAQQSPMPVIVSQQAQGGGGQVVTDFPVDMDQPRAFKFWPGDAYWKQAAIAFEGDWLQAWDAAVSATELVQLADRPSDGTRYGRPLLYME